MIGKRKQLQASTRKSNITKERVQSENNKTEALLYKRMARTFWDQWQWELQKRKELMQQQLGVQRLIQKLPCTQDKESFHEIDESLLLDPLVDGKPTEEYIGIVLLQLSDSKTKPSRTNIV